METRVPTRIGSRRGAVLLVILVIIVVLSAVLVQFTEKGMTEIVSEGHYVERNRLRLTAFSALETTLAVMADVIAIDGALTAPAQGWGDPLTAAGFDPGENLKVSVAFVDESGKLPLGNLDEGTLLLLFNEMGLAIEDSLKLTHALLDWVDEDDEARLDGAESETYAVAEWPYAASNRAVQRLSELAVVDGFNVVFFDEAGRPNELFRQFASAVSPYADGSINANSVGDLALRAFAGFGDPQVAMLRSYLAGADGLVGTADDRYFTNNQEVAALIGNLPAGVTLGVTSQVMRVHITVTEGESRYALEAVVQPARGGGATGATGAPTQGRNPARPVTAGSQTTGRGSQSTDVPYPFVFLELTEDVGQNDSLAASAAAVDGLEAEATSSGSASRRDRGSSS